ncbi:nucleoside diphosphate kinase regulator [Massilia sp. 2TAF26]|uniref:nucleoside diphosphate kinase regulator n=1 Tax=Massilia sp. 2TAF26 TaxID=3233012 RepID=UPI003F9B0572
MRPNITVSTLDMARLEALFDDMPVIPGDREYNLLDELGRADVVDPDEVPSNVVTMNSTVRFAVDHPPQEFCMTLVYPKDVAFGSDRLSVMSPIGSALLGLAVGDTIEWARPGGELFKLTALELLYQPERSGELHR